MSNAKGAPKAIQSVMAYAELTELVERVSSKSGETFLTGTFSHFSKPQNGTPNREYMQFICKDSELFEQLQNANASGERISFNFVPVQNSYIKKDKNKKEVQVDGKPLWINDTKYSITDII